MESSSATSFPSGGYLGSSGEHIMHNNMVNCSNDRDSWRYAPAGPYQPHQQFERRPYSSSEVGLFNVRWIGMSQWNGLVNRKWHIDTYGM